MPFTGGREEKNTQPMASLPNSAGPMAAVGENLRRSAEKRDVTLEEWKVGNE